ncbi:MAG TPA: bifunctional YncE family protein/alkaline phosphatase family protein [Bryobacteraceae bacterium]|jgi:YVTN family beta-propeller protein
MLKKWLFVIPATLGLALIVTSQPVKQLVAGVQEDGSAILPNGWRVKAAGSQIALDTFPMASALSKNGRFLAVLNGGYKPPSIEILTADTLTQVAKVPLEDGWLGLQFSPDGKFLYAGGASRANVQEFAFDNGKLTPSRTFTIVPEADRKYTDFIGDVTTSPDGHLIYAADVFHNQIVVINPQSGRVIEKFKTGRRPYRILFHPDGETYFVSSWADGTIYQHRASNGELVNRIGVAPHPTDILLSNRKPENTGDADDDAKWKFRLFVTAANTNQIFSIGVSESKELHLLESINVAMSPRQPAGMTPTALALSPDQKKLYVVCSDANAAAVVDLNDSKSRVAGFVPTGWYPTAARVMADGRLIVLNGRGSRSYPNPKGPNPFRKNSPVHSGIDSIQYVAAIQVGSASVIPPFDDDQLDKYSKEVYANSPYRDDLLDDARVPAGNPIPTRPADKTPIENVIFILKENRTYDQVLGGIGKGNSDASLVLFDEKAAPNHYKLAREFVLFDNFYVNADVSADGHNWSTAAIAPDYVQKMWPNSYAGRRKHYDYEGGEPAALPPAGYLWNNALQGGVTIRNYGFWTAAKPKADPDGDQVALVKDPALAPYTNMKYRGFDLDFKDVDRAQIFISELHEFEQKGEMPKLIFMRIGNDHTSGTAPGKIAPLSSFADNDAALGMIVEAVSKSKFWPKTAIFVMEDDAQNGADHVDSHRSPAFVISPYVRRGAIDSTFYNQTSVLRTMELILGLRPMTQFDAASRPMWTAFQPVPDTRPYTAEKPRRSLDERNPQQSGTSERSAKMDFSEADLNDDDELNDILWRAIKRSEPPVPVRSFFGH